MQVQRRRSSAKRGAARSPKSRARRTLSTDRQTSAQRHRAAVFQALRGFRRVIGSARRYDASVRRISGIPGSLLWALSEITNGAGIGVNALAHSMALHQTTASNLVNALVDLDLVQRSRNAMDGRSVRLSVSSKGQRLLRLAPQPRVGLLMDALQRLDLRRLNQLRVGLEWVLAEMRLAAPQAAGETLLGE